MSKLTSKFEVIRGFSLDEGFLKRSLKIASGETHVEGMVVTYDATDSSGQTVKLLTAGAKNLPSSPHLGSETARPKGFLCLNGNDSDPGSVKTFAKNKGNYIEEKVSIKTDQFDAGAYAVEDLLTINAGKWKKTTETRTQIAATGVWVSDREHVYGRVEAVLESGTVLQIEFLPDGV